MSHGELSTLDATGQAQLVRRKEVTPLELVEWSIARIERFNSELNAVVTPLFDKALDEARSLMRARSQADVAEAPFDGVPFLIKELTDVKGVVTTWSSRLSARVGRRSSKSAAALPKGPGLPAPEDAEIVRRFRRAGFLFVGRSNAPELGLLPTTEPELYGATRNPWDLTRTPGGSSGGAAAAVAAGLVPIAHANDGGGSIRIPASCCGLFGLKPSRGRTPTDPLGLLSEHVITRSVRDSAAVLDCIAGGSPGSPYTLARPSSSFLSQLDRSPRRLRIGVSFVTPTGEAVHPDCEAAVREAAKLCEGMGHDVVGIARVFDGEATDDAFQTLWTAGLATQIEAGLDHLGIDLEDAAQAGFERATFLMYKRGRALRGTELLVALARLEKVLADVEAFFQEYDLWMTPTLATPPPLLGSFELASDDLDGLIRRNNAFSPFTVIANICGTPAASLPLYRNGASLPIGVQIMGPIGSEGTLLGLAAQFEQARPWNDSITESSF